MLRSTIIAITALLLCVVHANMAFSDFRYVAPVPPYPPNDLPPEPTSKCNQKSLPHIINAVTCKFLKQIVSKDYQNGGFAISGFSIAQVLFMLDNAAAGSTRRQLDKYIKVCDLNKLNEEFRAYLGQLMVNQKDSQGKLQALTEVAAGLFVADNYTVIPAYEQNMTYYLGAMAKNLPFETDPPGATGYINDFIRTKTHGVYPQFFPSPLPANTVALEVDVFYLLSAWLKSDYFTLNYTKQYFYPSCNQEPVYAQYMSNGAGTNPTRYTTIKDGNIMYNVVHVPLITDKYSVILMQSQNRCQKSVSYLKNLTPAKIAHLFKALGGNYGSCQVWFDVPQFQVNSSFNVVNILEAGGVTDLSENANLRNGFVQSEGDMLNVGTIDHKCYLSVNRTAILGAAVTTVDVTSTGILECNEDIIRVIFDYEFIFFIVFELETIIFSGSINDPNYPFAVAP